MLGYNHEWRLISPVTTVDELFAVTKGKGCLEPMDEFENQTPCQSMEAAFHENIYFLSLLFPGASGYVPAFWMVRGTFGWRLYPLL